MSGYLYAINDYKPYKARTSKRLVTLLIPYLIWSTAGLLLIYSMELFPASRAIVASSGLAQIDNSRMLIHNYYWYEIAARWLFFR
jgi:fucose 4-O-acetylase-like acetyltransferase